MNKSWRNDQLHELGHFLLTLGGTGTNGCTDTVELLSLEPKEFPVPEHLRTLPAFPKKIDKGFAFPLKNTPHVCEIMAGTCWKMQLGNATMVWKKVGKMRERRGRFAAACYHKSTGPIFSGGIAGLDIKYLGRHGWQNCNLKLFYFKNVTYLKRNYAD